MSAGADTSPQQQAAEVAERPEAQLAGAFAGGFLLALILKKLGS